MESFSNYRIYLFGENGQLAKAIKSYFLKNKIKFRVIGISKKDNLFNLKQLNNLLKKNIKGANKFVLINTIASLYPKDKSDEYINKKMPIDLLNFAKKYNSFLIHLSTNNVLVPELLDDYTKQKRDAEKLIINSNYEKFLIIRLPLLIPFNDLKKKIYTKQFKLLMKMINFPFVALIPPSRNIYKPMDIKIVARKISKFIVLGEFLSMEKVISLNGPKKMQLDKLCNLLMFSINKKPKINFGTRFFWFIVDCTVKTFPFLKNILMGNTLLQQLLPIER